MPPVAGINAVQRNVLRNASLDKTLAIGYEPDGYQQIVRIDILRGVSKSAGFQRARCIERFAVHAQHEHAQTRAMQRWQQGQAALARQTQIENDKVWTPLLDLCPGGIAVCGIANVCAQSGGEHLMQPSSNNGMILDN